ncbi:MAG: metallophosphoesterase, partial [Clostridia bacterium]|nr:metallophosphoesterase [Clostridia bacterium]
KPAAMKEIGTITYGRSMDYFPTTIGNFLPIELEATKIQESFEGEIANVRFWSDARTTEEIVANSQNSVGADAEGLIAEWMLSGEEFYKETTGKYDLKSYYWNISTDNELYEQYLRTSADGEFTIVFVPDTQTVMKNFKGQEASLFDWIIANKEKLNIKAVVGLGDITEYTNSTSKRNEEEWQLMSAQWNRLTEAQIPWVPTIGDHDYENLYVDDCTLYNKYFTKEMLYQDDNFQLGGLYDENSLVNGYYLLEVTPTTKFLIMNLEVLPRDEVLEWANQVIADHPEYGVIVATHRNMTRVYCERYTEVSYNHGNAGEAVWQKMVSQHNNMVAYMSGHTETTGYYANYDTGVNGNTVLQMVCDMQNHDQYYKTLQEVVTMRFSADASTAILGAVGTRPNILLDSDGWEKTWNLNVVKATPAEKYEVVFKDTNGAVLNTLEVTEGKFIKAEDVPAAPARYGYTFTDWSFDVNQPVMSDLIITALYEKNGEMKYDVTISENVEMTLPEGQENCYYNDRVKIVAAAEKDGEKFSYWTINGGIFSYSKEISFLMFGDANIEAVYGAEVADRHVIFIDSNPTVTDHNNGKYDMHIMGVAYSPTGTVEEIGVILAAGEYTAEEMLDGTAVTKSFTIGKATEGRQFVYTVKNIAYDQVRTAIVYAVIDGVTYYSNVSCTAVVETILPDGEYGGGEIVDGEAPDPFN